MIRQFGKRSPGINFLDRPGAYVIIINSDHQIALVKTPKGHFLPGGGVELGEKLEQALVREETGLIITLSDKIGTSSQLVYSQEENQGFNKIGTFFRAQILKHTDDFKEQDHNLVWESLDFALNHLDQEFQKWAVSEWRKSYDKKMKSESGGSAQIISFAPEMSLEVSNLISSSILATHEKFYSKVEMENLCNEYSQDKIVEKAKDRNSLVVIREGKILGYGSIGGDKLKGIYIQPANFGRGLGQMLLGRLEDIARDEGITELNLYASFNAKEFYLRQGFVVFGEMKDEN